MPRAKATVSELVIQKVANRANSDALELPPLYDAIDPDALDALVEGMSDGEITFTYAGYETTVESDGTIHLVDIPAGDTASGVAWS